MDIRTATSADLRALVRLSAALFQEDAGRHDPTMNLDWPAQEGHAYFHAVITDPQSVCLVAASGQEVAGYLVGRSRPASSIRPVQGAELESMYVQPKARSQGVGARLAVAFLDWAAGRHAPGRRSPRTRPTAVRWPSTSASDSARAA